MYSSMDSTHRKEHNKALRTSLAYIVGAVIVLGAVLWYHETQVEPTPYVPDAPVLPLTGVDKQFITFPHNEGLYLTGTMSVVVGVPERLEYGRIICKLRDQYGSFSVKDGVAEYLAKHNRGTNPEKDAAALVRAALVYLC